MWRWRKSTQSTIILVNSLIHIIRTTPTTMSASESSSSSASSVTNAVYHDEQSSGNSSRSRSSSPSPSSFEPPTELLDEYTRLLASQFDLASIGLLPTQPPRDGSDNEDGKGEGGRPMTKAEKQNAKKKRRKERERLAREQAALAQKSNGNGGGQAHGKKDTFGELFVWLFRRFTDQDSRVSTFLELSYTVCIDSPTRRTIPTSLVCHLPCIIVFCRWSKL